MAMKYLFIVAGCCAALLAINGCQNSSAAEQGVRVFIEGDGEFPEFLVGRWKSNAHGWQFLFDEDGSISWSVISMGRMEIDPGKSKITKLREGGKGIYEPGLWSVEYSPESRELTVKVVMEHIRLEMGDHILEGKMTDVLIGEVDEESKTWRADWFSYPDYIAYVPEPKPITLRPDENLVGTLTFEKVEE
jgi:hypothetical protein